MNKNHLFILVLLVIFFAFIIIALTNYSNKDSLLSRPGDVSKQNEKVVDVSPTEGYGFVETGNLVNTDPLNSAHGPEFSLLYEKPGSPALKVDLVFTEESRCKSLNDFRLCKDVNFRVGDGVQVKGNKSGEKLEVAELEFVN